MQGNAPDAPDLTDAACREATGKSLAQWFAVLAASPGPRAGRRDLVPAAYDALGKDEWWATTIAVEFEKARGQVEKGGRPKGCSLCSTKTIAAPLAAVFAAFGDAKRLDRWLGPKTSVHFADGGTLRNADGDALTFTRLRQHKDIRATWRAKDLAPDRRQADVLRAGWARCLETLKTILEAP